MSIVIVDSGDVSIIVAIMINADALIKFILESLKW